MSAGANAARWKSAWVIGASTGIGRELALKLAPMCGTVHVSARSADKLSELAAIKPNIHPLPLDVTDSAAVRDAALAIARDGAMPDLVVIASGYWKQARLPDFRPDDFRTAMETNFIGAINAIAATAPEMTARGSGHIALIASVSGLRGLPNAAAYAPTKAALINLAECIRPQLARKGVKVSIINPGFVDTPMTAVNKFPMPFIMPADKAAAIIANGLARERYEITFPLPMLLIFKLLRMMPNALFFRLVNRFVLGRDGA